MPKRGLAGACHQVQHDLGVRAAYTLGMRGERDLDEERRELIFAWLYCPATLEWSERFARALLGTLQATD